MKDPFSTTDLSLAAYLFVQPDAVKFHGLEPMGKSEAFMFTPKRRCEALALQFTSGQASVNAFAYASAIKGAKSLIFQTRTVRNGR